METQTSNMSEETMTQDDRQMPTMNLGSAQQFQDLDNVAGSDPRPNKPKAEPKSEPINNQGKYEGDLYKYEAELEKTKTDYEKMLNGGATFDNYTGRSQWEKYLTEEEIKQFKNKNGKDIQLTPSQQSEYNQIVKEAINKKIEDNYKKINDIKDSEDYDDRTDGQKREDDKQLAKEDREDNAYNRAVADMRSAGLNPMLMYGSGGPAGASGGSSSGEGKYSKEKERNKRRQEEERQRKEREDRERQRIMSSFLMAMLMGGITKM